MIVHLEPSERSERGRGEGEGEGGGKKIKNSDMWAPQLVIGIESDIENGWVRRN